MRSVPMRHIIPLFGLAIAACAQAPEPGSTPAAAPATQAPAAQPPAPPPVRADTFARAPRRGYVPKSSRADTLRGSWTTPGRRWWDVSFYDLNVRINPKDSSIAGYNG